jgi:hypothetical protein
MTGGNDGVDVSAGLTAFGGEDRSEGRDTAIGGGNTLTGAGGCDADCFAVKPEALGFGTVLTDAGAP